MRNVNETVYLFNELPEAVQKNVIENNRYINVDDSFWFNFIYEDFVFTVKEKYGVTLDYNEISFSGFYSQGDGASFTHTFSEEELARLIDALNISFRHGLKNLFIEYCEAKIQRISNYYSHEGTVSAYILAYSTGHDRIDNYFEKKAEELEKAVEKWKNELCRELYSELTTEYEYETEDEAVANTLDAIEDEYYIDGTVYTEKEYYIDGTKSA